MNFNANCGITTFVEKIFSLISKGSDKPTFSDFRRYDNFALSQRIIPTRESILVYQSNELEFSDFYKIGGRGSSVGRTLDSG